MNIQIVSLSLSLFSEIIPVSSSKKYSSSKNLKDLDDAIFFPLEIFRLFFFRNSPFLLRTKEEEAGVNSSLPLSF